MLTGKKLVILTMIRKQKPASVYGSEPNSAFIHLLYRVHLGTVTKLRVRTARELRASDPDSEISNGTLIAISKHQPAGVCGSPGT